ncbi:mitochondrial outer membrane protein porin of 36 kDa [Tanacetum coccineum]
MAKAGPGLYTDMGKKAKDLLYRDYQSDHKFSLTTYTANGVYVCLVRLEPETFEDIKVPDQYHLGGGLRYAVGLILNAFCGICLHEGRRWKLTLKTVKVALGLEYAVAFAKCVLNQSFSTLDYFYMFQSITSTGAKRGEFFLADVNTKLINKNITTDVRVDTSSKVFTTITVDEPAPGLKTIFSFVVPDQKSGKAELQYLHENAGISASIGLTAKPLVNFSAVAGNNTVALGADISFDTATGDLTKYNGGLSFTTTDLIASLTLNDKADTLIASYYHTVSPLTNTAVGAELTHGFSSNENSLTIGTQHALEPPESVKLELYNFGIASALLQHEWRPKSLFTISAEVDTRAIEKSAKVGLALALKP